MERRGVLEMLISCGEEACVLQSVARCLRVCAYLSDVSVSVLGVCSSSLRAAPVTPFYSRRETQGRYMCLLCGVLFGRGGMSEPYSLSLWRYGRWNGLVLGALE